MTVGLFLERKLNVLLRKISYESAESLNISRINFSVLFFFCAVCPENFSILEPNDDKI